MTAQQHQKRSGFVPSFHKYLRKDPTVEIDLINLLYLPSFNSPKFPQPIFLPTRKFGPTMRTPEELEEPDGRDVCPLRLPWETFVLLAGRSPYLSLCGSMAWAAQFNEGLVWCVQRPPWGGPTAATALVNGSAEMAHTHSWDKRWFGHASVLTLASTSVRGGKTDEKPGMKDYIQ